MAIVMALCLTLLLVATAMVLDFGMIRLDRQKVRSIVDEAATAGMVAADNGTGEVYTYRGVCGALDYLKTVPSLSGLPENFCNASDASALNMVACDVSSPSTHFSYDESVTSDGITYRVVIKSPYALGSGTWDESLGTRTSDPSAMSGCDQVGVEIFESRRPGLGSLATDGDLMFGLRAVSRAIIGGDDFLSPSLLLLERTACSALTVGAAGSGSGTYIKVYGMGSSPGSIHVDSNATGSDCGSGSNQQVMQGKQADGIVAYGSPSPTGVAGLISSVAKFYGVPVNVIIDNPNQVYGTTSVSGTGVDKSTVQGRRLVGRTPVDRRYRAGVRSAISAAASVWGSPTGWTVANCNPTAAQLAVTTKLWIECPNNSGITLTNKTISASEIYFNGFIKNGVLDMPNATRVYISNTSNSGGIISSSALNLSNNTGFCVRATCGTAASDSCSNAAGAPRARIFVKQGTIDASGGLLRACHSTVLMLGGNTSTGCVPSIDGTAPTSTPCSGGAGNGTINVSGQTVLDWTSPNQYADTIPTASQPTEWANFEDLALWSESAGSYAFSGGGVMNTRGIYMIPNGSPVSVGGGSNQALVDAQYIAQTFQVNGGGTLSITTNPKNAVSVPTIRNYVLVR